MMGGSSQTRVTSLHVSLVLWADVSLLSAECLLCVFAVFLLHILHTTPTAHSKLLGLFCRGLGGVAPFLVLLVVEIPQASSLKISLNSFSNGRRVLVERQNVLK